MRISRLKNLKLLISDPSDIFYFTGFYPQFQAFLLIDRKPVLFLCEECRSKIEKHGLEKLKEWVSGEEVGIDEKNLAVEWLKKLEIKPWPASQLIKKLRMVKEPEEVEKIKRAVRVTKEILEEIEIKGREIDVEWQIRQKLAEKRALPAFQPIVASGPNSRIIHHRPEKRKIRKGDVVILDLGARIDFYCSDITRTLGGDRELRERVLDIQGRIIDMLEPGRQIKEIDREYERLLGRKPWHSWGHGIGIDVHEPLGDTILEGMVLTVEPGIYQRTGCRFEDVVWIRKKGARVL
ncbi:MAG: hypothetical protein DRP12_01880 [Candidatus Aenigmatarchaeota archaeon]|nr:MAG: hypothetical protein DRP12_01880 [Candidatus Aenigmarchaeota archaeon]